MKRFPVISIVVLSVLLMGLFNALLTLWDDQKNLATIFILIFFLLIDIALFLRVFFYLLKKN